MEEVKDLLMNIEAAYGAAKNQGHSLKSGKWHFCILCDKIIKYSEQV